MTDLSNSLRRLPLPPQVALMTAVQEPALRHAKAFIDRLCDLPLGSWLTVGRAVMGNQGTSANDAAWSAVEEAIAAANLGLAVWHVRDEIQTLAYLASHSRKTLSRTDRQVLAAALGAAENAALALLVCGRLAASDLEHLLAPFGGSTLRLARAIRPTAPAHEC